MSHEASAGGGTIVAESGDQSTGELRGRMGALDVIFTVLSFNGPLVVFMGFMPVAILLGNQLGTPAAWLAAGAVIAVIGSGLIKVSNYLDRPGGFYSIITAGLGRVPGLAAGFAAVIAYFAALLSVYGLAGVAISDTMKIFFQSTEIPWWVGGIAALIVVNILGYFNISFSAKVLTVFLSLELLLIAVYCVAVLLHGGTGGIGFDSFLPSNIFSGNLAIAALFSCSLFGGFEATVIFRDEVRNPKRTIRRATYGVIALMAFTYALLAWLFINAYGPSTVMAVLSEDPVGAVGESIKTYVGDFAYYAAVIMLLTSAFALALAAHNILSRYLFSMAKDGVFPSKLAVVHDRQGSPHVASLVSGVFSVIVVAILALSGVPNQGIFGYLAGIYGYTLLAILTFVSIALGVYLIRNTKNTSDAVTGWLMIAVFVMLTAVLIFATLNFELLSGLGGLTGWLMVGGIWLFVLCGMGLALFLKRKNPLVFARIGRQ